jgi:hypothetical protein
VKLVEAQVVVRIMRFSCNQPYGGEVHSDAAILVFQGLDALWHGI